MRFIIVATALALALPAGAQAPATASVEQQLAANLARGDELYAYDQSAWHVTDAMMETVPAATKKLMRGYITTTDSNGFRTTFYGGEVGQRVRLYSAVWTGSAIAKAEVFAANAPPPVTAEEARLIAAREVAVAEIGKMRFCSEKSPNTAVIPGAKIEDPVSVYFMTPQDENGVYPLGGHNRADVRDGKVISIRQFTRSCISLGGAGKKDEHIAAMAVTHLLDPVPTEIHAFTVHASGVPLMVGMSDGSMYSIGLRSGKAFAEKDK